MRLVNPADVTLTTPNAHPLTFRGARGERFEIAVLDHDLIRVRHHPEGTPRLDRTWLVVDESGDTPFAGRDRNDLSLFPLPEFALTEDNDKLLIETDALRLEVFTGDFRLRWLDDSGNPFAADVPRRAYVYNAAGTDVFHYMERTPLEHYFGFGEKAGPLDKAGMRLRMVNGDALGYNARTSDPLYKHYPFYITFLKDRGIAYGLFYDNLAETVFDLGKEINVVWGRYRYYQALHGDLDYTLIYGPTVEAVVEKFTALTGRPALPPRWSLGYLGSTMLYTEMPDAQEQLKQFARLCDEHDIPCDMFHLSSGYTTDERGNRNVFTWNTDKIPEPAQMAADFHAAGIQLAANVKPHLLATHPHYAEAEANGLFIQAADEDTPEIIPRWSSGVFDSADAAYLDFTNPDAFAWWKTHIKSALLEYGIDAVWNDNNEFEIWDDDARCHGAGKPIPAALTRPLQTLLMGRASFEAMREFAPDRRPFLLTRAGCPGLQRYAQTWSGDNFASWETLRYNIPMGLNLSLSGMPNTGHDVGGFFGERPERELFVRWVQNGIFHPRFTIHSSGMGGVNEPWMYPDVLPLVRDAIDFRYRLIPYLYALFHEAAATGHPIIRPTLYHFPEDKNTHTESFDFLLGPFLLVASVLEEGATTRSVYLPGGEPWCDFHTGQWHNAGQTITLDAPLDRFPLLVRAGGIIPTGKRMRHVGAEADDVREVLLFPPPGEGSSAFTLYEDDGVSLRYSENDYTKVAITLESTPDAVTVKIEKTGDYPLPYREMAFILPPGDSRPLHVANGQTSTGPDGRTRATVPVV